jgi:hypothetical protein
VKLALFRVGAAGGGACIILSLVGLLGRLIGMLSGLLDPPEPEAASGGLAIDELLFCGGFCCVCAGFAVCANAVTAPFMPRPVASATPAVNTPICFAAYPSSLAISPHGSAPPRWWNHLRDAFRVPRRAPAYAPETC